MIHATRTEAQPACRTDRRDASSGTFSSGDAAIMSSVREAEGRGTESRSRGHRGRDHARPWYRTGADRISDRPTGIVVGRRR